jgi:hypothetical protein
MSTKMSRGTSYSEAGIEYARRACSMLTSEATLDITNWRQIPSRRFTGAWPLSYPRAQRTLKNMSEQPKKARDIKDLKARLGRAPGGSPSMPGPVSGIPAPLPMPGGQNPGIPRGAEVPAPFAPAPAPRQSIPSQNGPSQHNPAQTGRMPAATGRSMQPPSDPFAAPMGNPFPAPTGAPSVAPGAPQQRQSIPSDPFASVQPVQAAREVRLVFDDKAVDDSEIGRKSGSKFAVAAAVAAAVGILVGWFVGGTQRERQLYDLVLADAKEIYGAVQSSSATVEQAKSLLDKAVKSASPTAGKSIELDFKALEDLRKLPKPFPADVFSRKHYRALDSATVDSLFQYYNNTNLLWAKINTLSAKALTPAAKEGLTKSAKSAGELATTDYGCIPFKADKEYGCGIVAVTKGEEGKVTAITRGGSYEKQAFAGQDLSSKTSDYVIMIDKGRSGDILSAPTNQFQSFARDLMEAKTLADATAELQGQLTKLLGKVVALEALN